MNAFVFINNAPHAKDIFLLILEGNFLYFIRFSYFILRHPTKKPMRRVHPTHPALFLYNI